MLQAVHGNNCLMIIEGLWTHVKVLSAAKAKIQVYKKLYKYISSEPWLCFSRDLMGPISKLNPKIIFCVCMRACVRHNHRHYRCTGMAYHYRLHFSLLLKTSRTRPRVAVAQSG
jgi:hypothetical protein